MKTVIPPTNEAEHANLAQVIDGIGKSLTKLLTSGLNRRAVVALVHDDTHIPKREIESVLRSVEELRRNYTQP